MRRLRPYVFTFAKVVGVMGAALGAILGTLLLLTTRFERLRAESPTGELYVLLVDSLLQTATLTAALVLVLAAVAVAWYLR